MKLQSMTGFARQEGEHEGFSWVWEMRSVNGKGLDLRFRIPAGFEALEIPVRQLTQKSLKRGNIQVAFQIQIDASQDKVSVNREVIETLLKASQELKEEFGGDLPTIAELLAIKGVVELDNNKNSQPEEKLLDAIIAGFKQVLKNLVTAREAEGEPIGNVLLEQVVKIENICGKIEEDPSRTPEAIGKVVKGQVERILSESDAFDEQRLHQEAVLLSAKADIQEELDRLKVHVASARSLLSAGGPIGRKLDFLAQEFNRECNTICSKSNSATVTSLGLDMKLIIDQFREQLQNME